MRTLAALGALTVLALASAPEGSALLRKPARLRVASHVRNMQSPLQRATMPLLWKAALAHKAARPHRTSSLTFRLSALEVDIVARLNAQRGARGLRPLRVSRGLTAAAKYHCRQMGLFGFFEHESHNGTPFWRRIQRFYPPRHGYWSVGENILWASPDTSASGAVRDWMASPPHRQNILTGEYRDVGVAAVHFGSAPGAFGGRPVTIVTSDFGVRR